MHLLEARRAFDKALQFDPGSVEANLYRVYMLLSRGEKESARHGIEHLLQTASNDWNVHLVAGQTLRIDGMYEDALDQFNTSLRLNPSNAAVIYNHRARVYQYQNQIELAADEIEKGLTLEPRQPLLRISLGYQQMRTGDLTRAIETLEAVTRDEKSLRIVYPTIALCYVQLGDRAKAASFIIDETLSAAEADSEMALPSRHLLRCRRRRVRSPPLAPPRHLPRQRELPLVLHQPSLEKNSPATTTSSASSKTLKNPTAATRKTGNVSSPNSATSTIYRTAFTISQMRAR